MLWNSCPFYFLFLQPVIQINATFIMGLGLELPSLVGYSKVKNYIILLLPEITFLKKLLDSPQAKSKEQSTNHQMCTQ